MITRRTFLKHSMIGAGLAAGAFPQLISSSALGANGAVAAGERLTIGCIGTGPQGRGVMGNFLAQKDARVVAVCDLATRNLEAAKAQVNAQYGNHDCAIYTDFRQLLARKDIDAVLVATPDHWHVPAALAAVRAGKDVYLEKPMGLSVEEDQLLRKVVLKKKAIFQFGTQQRSSSQFRQACELVRNGRIGKLQEIHVWCSASHPGGSSKPVSVPPGLDYDFWLGPALEKPYTDGKCFDNDPPGSWKTWWFNTDYALGFVAGWGVHPLDIAYWGYPEMLQGVVEVEGKAVIPTEGACNTSVAWDVRMTCASGVRLIYKGTRNGYETVTPMNDLQPWEKKYGRAIDHGTAFVGTDGWVLVDRGAIRASPEGLLEEKLPDNAKRLMRSDNHVRNFLDSIRSRTPAICHIEDAVQADILCHLSDISSRLERKLKWDPKKESFVGDKEANQRLKMRPMRDKWRIA